MRAVFLNQYARPSDSAGITRHADLGSELVRRGHAVTIVASSYDYLRREKSDEQSGAEVSSAGVRFVWLDTGTYDGNGRGRVASMVRYGQAAARATMRLDPKPDIVVGSSAHLLAGLAALVAARRLRIPWVLEVRDFWPSALVDLGAIRRGGAAHRVLARLERYLYERAPRIVSIPPNGALRLHELGIDPGKLVHIPNASAGTESSQPIPASLEAVLNQLSGRFLVVYTGSIGEAHDLESALSAMDEMRRVHPELAPQIGLLLVGDGVKRDALISIAQRFACDNVRFHAAVPKGAIPGLIHRADACLMQAGAADYFKYGLSPNKLFDYFAAGKPVLIASAYPTIVDEARAGLRFEPGRPAAFIEALTRLLDLPASERVAMGERGKELVRTRYSIPAIADTYESVLKDVIARHRR